MDIKDPRLKAIAPGLEARANRLIADAIGAHFEVRESPHVTTTGVIVAASIARVHVTPRAAKVVFRIVMECGVAKMRREFHVKSLPRR